MSKHRAGGPTSVPVAELQSRGYDMPRRTIFESNPLMEIADVVLQLDEDSLRRDPETQRCINALARRLVAPSAAGYAEAGEVQAVRYSSTGLAYRIHGRPDLTPELVRPMAPYKPVGTRLDRHEELLCNIANKVLMLAGEKQVLNEVVEMVSPDGAGAVEDGNRYESGA